MTEDNVVSPFGDEEDLPLDDIVRAWAPPQKAASRDSVIGQEKELLYTSKTTGKGEDKKEVKTFTMNTENLYRALAFHPDFKGSLRYDVFTQESQLIKEGIWKAYTDEDTLAVQGSLSVAFPDWRLVSKQMTADAMIRASLESKVNSGKDEIISTRWDGYPRLDVWLAAVYGVRPDAYHKAVGENWVKGMVKRICEPGCKFDYVLVLEGAQGLKKSTSLETLAGSSRYVETVMSTDSKDFFMQFLGKSIVEFSEGETLSRTETKRMKGIISTKIDRYRPPYGMRSTDVPRTCVFAMTINQSEYLKDETGNRRWLPVAVQSEADIGFLERNRLQMLAEAYHRVFILGESVWELPKGDTEDAQEARREKSPNEDLIVSWYARLPHHQRVEGITIQYVYAEALCRGFPSRPIKKADELEIGTVLRKALHLEQRQVMIDGYRQRRWFPDLEKSPIPFETGELVF